MAIGGHMQKKLFSTLISLGFVLFFPNASFSQNINSEHELTSVQKEQVKKFSNGYADLINAIEARMSKSVDLRSPEAAVIFEKIQKCQVFERAEGDLIEISGDEDCGINYEVYTLKRDLGLNDSGDPITEIEFTEYFFSKSDVVSKIAGFVKMNSIRLDHSETLISTPVYATISTERRHFSAASGDSVLMSSRSRYYTNMENEEKSIFRVLDLQFPDFNAGFDYAVITDAEGFVKSKDAALNGKEIQLEDLQIYFTKYFLGLEI